MDRPDGRLNAWILAYAGETAWSAPSRLFQAPNFHPLPDALAFSENLLLPAAVVAPLQRLGGPVLAYNVALLGSLLLSGLGAQLLVRRVSGDRLAAFVAGAYFAAGPHRWTRLSHLHAQVTVFLPLALLALDRFWERRTLRRALAVGPRARPPGPRLGLPRRDHRRRPGGGGGRGALRRPQPARARAARRGLPARGGHPLARDAALPAHAGLPGPGVHARDGLDLRGLPAVVRRGGHHGWGWLSQRLLDPALVRDTLFPGVVALALGVPASPPPRAGTGPSRSRPRLVAVVFSLGPDTALYRFLHEHVVLVRGVRALARFALVPTLALAVLAGLALSGRRRLVGLAALVLDDGRVAEPPAAARALRRALAGGPVARREGRGGARPAPRARTTRSPCSTASRTAARS